MGDILFLAHRLPYPPDRGDKIRSHHILKALAKLAPVHVGCFAETESDYAHETHLAELAQSYFLPRRKKPVLVAGVEALLTGKTVSETAFHSAELANWVNETLASEKIDTIYVFSGQMGQYVPADFKGRILSDLVDVDSAKFEAYAEAGFGPRAWIDRREGQILSKVEKQLAMRSDHTLFVSEAEAALFRARTGHHPDITAGALRNGIDTSNFDPDSTAPHSEITEQSGPHFVFTGQMDYQPNIDACLRVIEKLLPAIREQHEGSMFHVVGRAPVAALLDYDGKNGVRIWGEVADVRPFVAAADIVLAPLTIARGVQNKVLEAMAMARPVLLTPEAATGIDGVNGVHFAVEAEDNALIDRALALVTTPETAAKLGRSAREFVQREQGWEAMLAPLSGLIFGAFTPTPAPEKPRHAA